jgi:hypothetical protein
MRAKMYLWGVKPGRRVRLTLPPSVSRLSRQRAILVISQLYRPSRPVRRITQLFTYIWDTRPQSWASGCHMAHRWLLRHHWVPDCAQMILLVQLLSVLQILQLFCLQFEVPTQMPRRGVTLVDKTALHVHMKSHPLKTSHRQLAVASGVPNAATAGALYSSKRNCEMMGITPQTKGTCQKRKSESKNPVVEGPKSQRLLSSLGKGYVSLVQCWRA